MSHPGGCFGMRFKLYILGKQIALHNVGGQSNQMKHWVEQKGLPSRADEFSSRPPLRLSDSSSTPLNLQSSQSACPHWRFVDLNSVSHYVTKFLAIFLCMWYTLWDTTGWEPWLIQVVYRITILSAIWDFRRVGQNRSGEHQSCLRFELWHILLHFFNKHSCG